MLAPRLPNSAASSTYSLSSYLLLFALMRVKCVFLLFMLFKKSHMVIWGAACSVPVHGFLPSRTNLADVYMSIYISIPWMSCNECNNKALRHLEEELHVNIHRIL